MESPSGAAACVRQCFVQTVALLCATGAALSMCAAQVLDGAVPDFQLNACRFLCTFALGLLVQLVTRLTRPPAKDPEEAEAAKSTTWLIPRHSLPRMLSSVVTIMLANVCMYAAACFLPVGTTAAMYAGFCVAWAGAWDAVRCRCTPLVGLAAGVSVLGVLLVTQPREVFQQSGLYRNPATNWSSPCRQRPGRVEVASFSGVYRFEGFNVTAAAVDSERTPLQEDFGENATDANNSTRLYYEEEEEQQLRTKAEWKGYLLMMATGFLSVWGFKDLAQLQKDIESTTVITIWALSAATLSIVISAIVETMSWLTDGFCISMVIVHSVGVSVYSICIIILIKLLPTVMVTIVLNFEFIMLMVFQHTFMAHIAPGLGNWLEWLGAALCLLATVLGPIGDYMDTRRSQKAGDYVDLDKESPDDLSKESTP